MRHNIHDYADRDTITENVWRSVIERIERSGFTLAFKWTAIDVQGPAPPIPKC